MLLFTNNEISSACCRACVCCGGWGGGWEGQYVATIYEEVAAAKEPMAALALACAHKVLSS